MPSFRALPTGRPLSGQAMFWAHLEEAHYNRWYQDFKKLKKVNTEKANRREALTLTGSIMKSCKVRSGRYRMGWSGVYGMMGIQPPAKPATVRKTSSILRRGKRISARQAQKEGTSLASAKEFKQGEHTHGIVIVNAVVYGPVEEARRGNVRRAIRHRAKYYEGQVAKAIIQAGKDSQK